MKIIYLIGIDGAGKTTLASNLVTWLKLRKLNIKYFYGQHLPFLIWPAKIVAKNFIFKKENEFEEYEKYYNKKTKLTQKFKFLSWCYALLWLIDYLLITWLRLLPNLIFTKYLIVDRYYIDIVVNIADTLKLNYKQMLKVLNIVGYFFPNPDRIFYINISPEVAYQRKDDIQALTYLQRRADKYNFLSKKLYFIELDGEMNQFELLKSLLNKMNFIDEDKKVELISSAS